MTEKANSEKNNINLEDNVSISNYKDNKFSDDNINIFEIILNFWDKKWIILYVTLIAVLAALFYYFVNPKKYRAEVLIITPINNVNNNFNVKNNFNVNNNFIINNYFRPNETNIFEKFKKNIISRKMQKKFVLEKNLLKVLDPSSTYEEIDVFDSFSSMINVHSREFFSITFLANDPNLAAEILNSFVKFVNFETVKNELNASQSRINQRITELNNLINTKRKMAKLRREDQISRFKEAIIIADSLGLKERVETTNIIQSTTNDLNSDFVTPVYYVGTKALLAEISVLKKRESDDPFIVGFRDLQEELAILKNYNFKNFENFGVKVDQLAYIPKSSIGQSMQMFVLIGLLAGIISSIIIIILISFFQGLHKNYLEKKRM